MNQDVKTNYERGEPIPAKQLNTIGELCNLLNHVVTAGPIRVERQGANLLIQVDAPSGSSASDVASSWTYETVGDTDEGDEAADTTDFTFGSDEKGLTLNLMTRVGYYHAGDKKLYGYIRTLNFAPNGRLISVSAETRIEIDAAEACS